MWKTTGDGGMYQFTVEQYHRMISTGIFHEGGRFELLEGYIVLGERQSPAHASSRERVRRRLERIAGEWLVMTPSAITIAASNSQPEPAASIVRGTIDDYTQRHPSPEDVKLVVEAAEASLEFVRHGKARIYARANIVEYWIVNIPDRQIEVYTQPSGPTESPAYERVQIYQSGSSVPLVLDGVHLGIIAIDEVIPSSHPGAQQP